MNNPLRVAVLMGGMSSEREVSLMSGRAIENALRAAGYEVRGVDVTDRELSTLNGYMPDVAFVALHGYFGEDGGVQTVLERKGIPYTGSGVEASKLAMNKVASKEAFIEHGIPTPDYCAVTKGCTQEKRAACIEGLGLPVVLKPVAEGSSVGVAIVKEMSSLSAALEDCFQYADHLLVERYIQGREITIGVLGNEALPVIELRTKREFYDYQAKYVDDDTEYITAPDLGEGCTERVQATALRAHNVLGCRGFSRVDMMVDREGKEFVIEINTIPGFTSHSLLPKAAAAVGIDFPRLCDRILKLAANGNGSA
ncbi:MAG: D-alanine--D-alanine ligase [Planctomycetes bacterium]|nr:D-alanine--D-alanine ligase [Planctomycetota bacterium]